MTNELCIVILSRYDGKYEKLEENKKKRKHEERQTTLFSCKMELLYHIEGSLKDYAARASHEWHCN